MVRPHNAERQHKESHQDAEMQHKVSHQQDRPYLIQQKNIHKRLVDSAKRRSRDWGTSKTSVLKNGQAGVSRLD